MIPSNPTHKEPLALDCELYRLRNRIERLNDRLKQFRAVPRRYEKTAATYLAFVQLAALRLWLSFVGHLRTSGAIDAVSATRGESAVRTTRAQPSVGRYSQ